MKRLLLLTLIVSLPANSSDLQELLAGRGIWLQAPRELNSAMLSVLKQVGVRRVHIMATDSPEKASSCVNAKLPTPNASDATIHQSISAIKGAQMSTILTVYLPPTKAAVDQVTAGIITKALNAGVDAVEFDLEGGWSKHPVCGYATHQEVFADLMARTKQIRPGVPVGITTHGNRLKDPRIPLQEADWASVQLYSRCKAGDCDAFDDPVTGPGYKQRWGAKRLQGYTKPVVVGLAAFGQEWGKDPMTIDKAMRLALEAVKVDPKFVGHSYWSTSWVKSGTREFKFLVESAKPPSPPSP